MIISTGFWSLILSVTGFFFIGPEHSYSVLFPEGTQLVQVDTLEEVVISHTFIGSDDLNNIEYSISFSVVGGNNQNLLKSKTINKYEESCNCEVVATQKVEYSNFRGVRYSIVKEVENTKLGGEVYISELKNGKSINVVSMVLYNQREYIDSNLNLILNTLVLNF